jgi:hypothetical protein
LLKQEDSGKPLSIRRKRKIASWNPDYLLRILSGKIKDS